MRVIGPSARGDRYFGHVFQRLFSAAAASVVGIAAIDRSAFFFPSDGASARLLDEYEKHHYPDQMSRVRVPRARHRRTRARARRSP